jgi:hypothetical protein
LLFTVGYFPSYTGQLMMGDKLPTTLARHGQELNVQQRLDLLARAKVLSSVSRACHEFGVSRTAFYKYRRQFESGALKAEKASPRELRQHPEATPVAVIEKLVNLARINPSWSGREFSDELRKDGGIYRSATTVCKILKVQGLGRRERLQLAECREAKSFETSVSCHSPHPENELEDKLLAAFPEQASFHLPAVTSYEPKLSIPTLKERKWQPERPGQKLCQYVFLVRNCGVLGPIYVHCVIDSHNLMAWARVSGQRLSTEAASLLRDEVLPFFDYLNLSVIVVATPSNRVFCAPPRRSHEREYEDSFKDEPEYIKARKATRQKFRALGVAPFVRSYRMASRTQSRDWKTEKPSIYADPANQSPDATEYRESMWARRQQFEDERKDKGSRPYARVLKEAGLDQVVVVSRGADFNSLALRFHNIIRGEFFTSQVREHHWRSHKDLQTYLERWLYFYNKSRANIGFPNQGKSPRLALNDYLSGRSDAQDEES